jgi:hypothetical protein
VAQDQADRRDGSLRAGDGAGRVALADLERRKRVAAIFAEGCFTTSQDYAAGALVFQHGEVADHFWLAFTWARRAVELGDGSKRDLAALAVDRYLVASGHKQLFGSQAQRATSNEACWCLAQIEPSFPEDQRAMWDKPLASRYEWVRKLNANVAACRLEQCDEPLAPTPRGTVPGVW